MPSSYLAHTQEAVFFIQQMDCPSEVNLIRERLGSMDGIIAMQFNLIQRELTVQHQLSSVAPIVTILTALGMVPKVKSDSLNINDDKAHAAAEHSAVYSIPFYRWLMVFIAGLAAFSAEVIAWTSGNDASAIVITLALLAILIGGATTLRKAWIALRHFSLNMHFLMSLAVVGAMLIGQWQEAAVVIVLFTLAEMIESLSLNRARNAIASLMSMTPDLATVRDQQGVWMTVPARQVAVQTIVRVAPGERIPLDGIVVDGQTTVNQAPITGENMPVSKQSGDPVFAGTINGSGAFDFRVTAMQQESTLARIVKSVQQAQGQQAPTQRWVDRFARYYIPAVVSLAVLVAFVPPVLFQAPFYPWLYKALVLLVISCPCALVISTPVTIVSGLAAAAHRGILIKGGVYLEQGRRLKWIAFDKTGTITVGRPVVTDVQSLEQDTTSAELLRQAASVASRSNHPVAAAVFAYSQAQPDTGILEPVTQLEELAGRGVRTQMGADAFYFGNHRLVHELNMCSQALEERLLKLEQQGKTVAILCRNQRAVLVLAVADTIRPTSRAAIAELQRLGIGATMLSGDNLHTVKAIADTVGILDARGGLLPDEKCAAVVAIKEQYGYVGMVGDGVNDAPALAQAQIGFAMGAAGTDTALETADVALMDDDLCKVADFIRLSRRTHTVLMQNIVVALGIKVLFLGLALAGKSTLWMAVFADMGASLLVVFNGLRLLSTAAASNQ